MLMFSVFPLFIVLCVVDTMMIHSTDTLTECPFEVSLYPDGVTKTELHLVYTVNPINVSVSLQHKGGIYVHPERHPLPPPPVNTTVYLATYTLKDLEPGTVYVICLVVNDIVCVDGCISEQTDEAPHAAHHASISAWAALVLVIFILVFMIVVAIGRWCYRTSKEDVGPIYRFFAKPGSDGHGHGHGHENSSHGSPPSSPRLPHYASPLTMAQRIRAHSVTADDFMAPRDVESPVPNQRRFIPIHVNVPISNVKPKNTYATSIERLPTSPKPNQPRLRLEVPSTGDNIPVNSGYSYSNPNFYSKYGNNTKDPDWDTVSSESSEAPQPPKTRIYPVQREAY